MAPLKARGVTVAVTGVCVGALCAMQPWIALLGTCLFVLFGGFPIAGWSGRRLVIGCLVGASLALGYGFSNVGVRFGSLPIPLAELLLAVLLLAGFKNWNVIPSTFSLPMYIFMVVIGLRLLIDFPEHKVLAVRDATLAVDVLAVCLGYLAGRRDGPLPWIRIFRVIFGIVLVYGTALQWGAQLASLGPTVGLQQKVSLLGHFTGIGVAAGAALVFFAIYSRGWKRILMIVWCIAVLGIAQFKGAYIAVILGLGVVVVLNRIQRPKIVASTAVALIACVLSLAALIPLGISGRLGPLSSDLYASQVGTLFGQAGVGIRSIEHRADWARATLVLVNESAASMVFGVGLGDDLAFGFGASAEVAVRKPHNDFLEIYARLGLLGSLVFLWLLCALIVPIVRRARSSPQLQEFSIWILATTLVYLFIAATQPLLAYPYGAIPLFFLLGLGNGVREPKVRPSLSNEPEEPFANANGQ